MSTSGLLLRRGPTTDRLGFTPLKGELIFDNTQNIVYVGDGSTRGGLSVFGDYIKVSDYDGRTQLDILTTTTGGFRVPIGGNANRPPIEISEDQTYSTGMIRFNNDTNQFEGYNGTSWGGLGGGGSDSLTSGQLAEVATLTANEIAGISALENAEKIWQFGTDTENWKGENVVLGVERAGVLKAIGSAVPGSGAAVNASYSEVSYGSDGLQTVDIYVPSTYNGGAGIDPAGVVMYIHGGGWAAGDKDDTYYVNIVNSLVNTNHVVVNVNYRLAPTDTYPAALNDIKTILSFLMIDDEYLNAPAAAQTNWSIARDFVSDHGLMVMGESAGGHLAVLGVMEHAVDNGVWPDAVVNFVGPMDLISTGSTDTSNPIGSTGISSINTFTNSSSSNIQAASPAYRLSTYQALSSYNSMTTKWYFWYNRNDTLVPSTSIVPFAEDLQDDLGTDQVFILGETHGTRILGTGGYPTNFIADHFVPSTIFSSRGVGFAQDVFSPTSSNSSPKIFYSFNEIPSYYTNDGNWSSSTAYVQNQYVSYNAVNYVCLVAHTSGDSFYTNLNSGYWEELEDDLPFDGSDNTLVTIKAKRTGGSGWVGKLYFDTTDDDTVNFPTDVYGQVSDDPTEIGSYKYIQFDMTDVQEWNGTIYGVKFELGATSADSFEIDWIAIGTDAPEQDVLVEGPRGPGRFGREISGSTWSDSEAEDEVFNTTGTDPKFGDVVVLFNASGTFSESKVYTDSGSGPGWETFNQYIDGSLVVSGTITADAIAANTITGNELSLDGTTITSDGNGAIQVNEINANQITAGTISTSRLDIDGSTIVNNNGTLELGDITIDSIGTGTKTLATGAEFIFGETTSVGSFDSYAAFRSTTPGTSALHVLKDDANSDGTTSSWALGVGSVDQDWAIIAANNEETNPDSDQTWANTAAANRNSSIAIGNKDTAGTFTLNANSDGRTHSEVNATLGTYDSSSSTAYAGVFNGPVKFNGDVTVTGSISGGTDTFTGLSDTPSSLGSAGQILQVNSGGTALEFVDASSGGSVTSVNTQTGAVVLELGDLDDVDTSILSGGTYYGLYLDPGNSTWFDLPIESVGSGSNVDIDPDADFSVGTFTSATTGGLVLRSNAGDGIGDIHSSHYYSGTGVTTGSGNYRTRTGDFLVTSDRREKENIEDIDSNTAIQALKTISPKTFNYIGGSKKKVGFIAQDIEEFYPELVNNGEDRDIKSLTYSQITAVLWKQNQQLLERIEQLEKKLEEK